MPPKPPPPPKTPPNDILPKTTNLSPKPGLNPSLFTTAASSASQANMDTTTVMQGYLLKLGSGVYRRWQKRYFVCNGFQLYYFANDKDFRDGKVPHHTLEVAGAKLQLLTVSPDNTKFEQEEHRNLCFEFDQTHNIEKHQRGKYHLIAPDSVALKKWMLALSAPVPPPSSFSSSSSSSSSSCSSARTSPQNSSSDLLALTSSISSFARTIPEHMKPSAGEQEFAEMEDAEPSVSRVNVSERPRSGSDASVGRLRTNSAERKSQTTSMNRSTHRQSVGDSRGKTLIEANTSTELEGFRESFESTIEGEIRAIHAEIGSDEDISDEEKELLLQQQKGSLASSSSSSSTNRNSSSSNKRARSDYVLPDRLIDYFFVVVPPHLLEKHQNWDHMNNNEDQDFFEKAADEHTWARTNTRTSSQASQDTDSDEKSSTTRDSVLSYTQRGSQFSNENSVFTTRNRTITGGGDLDQSKITFDPAGQADVLISPLDLAAIDVYPDKEYEGNPFDVGWMQFAFPLESALRPHLNDQPVRCHWAVITSGTQKRTIKLYFAFLTFTEYYLDGVLEQEQEMYIPKALVLVSHYPQFEFMRYCLLEIFASRFTNIPVERIISWLISEVPLPSAGLSLLELPFTRQNVHCGLPSIQMPLSSTLPLKFLFQKLSLSVILEMFKTIMTEGRILCHAYSFSTLLIICQSLFQLIYPFEWNGIFIPVVPEGSLAACGVLGPFVLGIHSDLLKEVDVELDGVLIVDIDSNTATHRPFKQRPDDVPFSMPAHAFSTLTKSLQHALKNEAQRNDEVAMDVSGSGGVSVFDASHVVWGALENEVLQAFLKFFNEILSGYRKVIFRIAEGPQCNLEEFLKEKGEVIDTNAIRFITTLFNSTMFMVFLERDKEYESEPLLKLYHDYIASPREKMLAIQSFKQIVHLSTGANLSASLIPLPSSPALSETSSPSSSTATTTAATSGSFSTSASISLLDNNNTNSVHEQKTKQKFKRLKKELFGGDNLLRKQLTVAPSRKFVAYRRASVGQQRSEEGESVLTIMMDIFHAKPINETDYKILIKCCTSSPQTVTTIVQQSMSNKNLAGAGGLVLSPASFVVLVFVFRYVLIVCAARNKIQHEIVNTVFEACSFYHCHELGKLSSESTETGTLKKQRYYMSGALSHAFGGDDQRSRDFWVKLISAELRAMIRARKRSAASCSPTAASSRSFPGFSSSTSSSSSSSCSCTSSSSSSSSSSSAASSSSSGLSPPILVTLDPPKPALSDPQKKPPPPGARTRPSSRHHSVTQLALKSPYRQTPGLQIGDMIVAKTPEGDKEGTIEFLGTTGFCVGDWVGISTKNGAGDCDGSRDGRAYFVCDPLCGVFVLESQVVQNKGSAQERALAHKTEDRLPQETVYHVMLTYITRMKDFRVHKATSEAVCQAVCDAHGMEERLKNELIQTILTMYRMDSSLEEIPLLEPDYSSQGSSKSVLEKDTPVFLRGRLRVQLLVKSSTAQLRKQTWPDVECILTDSCFAWVHADKPDLIEKSISIGNIHTIKRVMKPNNIEIRPKGKELSRVCLVLGYTVAENGRGKILPSGKNHVKKEMKETVDRENNVVDEWLKWLKLMKMVKLANKKEEPGSPTPSHRIRERPNDRSLIGRKQVRGTSFNRGGARH